VVTMKCQLKSQLNQRGLKRFFTSGILFALFTLLLSACDKTPDEEKIQNNIQAIQNAVENKELMGIGKYLHKDFLANRSMDSKQLKQMLFVQGKRHSNISIVIVSQETTIDPVYIEKAETTLSVVMAGSSGGLPEDGSVRVVDLEWRKVGSDWQIIKANWEHY